MREKVEGTYHFIVALCLFSWDELIPNLLFYWYNLRIPLNGQMEHMCISIPGETVHSRPIILSEYPEVMCLYLLVLEIWPGRSQ